MRVTAVPVLTALQSLRYVLFEGGAGGGVVCRFSFFVWSGVACGVTEQRLGGSDNWWGALKLLYLGGANLITYYGYE